MKQSKRIALSCALLLPIFIIGIDLLVIGVAIAPMAKSFHVPISTVQWFVTAYAMGYVALVGSSGGIRNRFGSKPLLIASLALFAFASLMVACAHAAHLVIMARILQGAAAGFMATTAIACTMLVFEDQHEQAVWIGWLVGSAGLGMALAPPLGGLMITYFGWRSIFLINVPIALISIVASCYALPSSTPNRLQKLNLFSLFFFMLTVFSLVIISQAPVWGWHSQRLWGAAFVFLVSGLCFFVRELRSKQPLLHLSLFRAPNFLPASWAGFTFYFILLGQIFIWGIYLEKALGYDSLQVGMHLLPIGLLMAIGSFTLRGALKKYSGKKLMILGSLAAVLSAGWMALMPASLHYTQLAIALALFGFGFFLVNSISTHTALTFIDPDKTSWGSSLCLLIRWFGGSFGASITSLLFVWAAQHAVKGMKQAPLLRQVISGHQLPSALNKLAAPLNTLSQRHLLHALHQGLVATQWLFAGLALLVALLSMGWIRSREHDEP